MVLTEEERYNACYPYPISRNESYFIVNRVKISISTALFIIGLLYVIISTARFIYYRKVRFFFISDIIYLMLLFLLLSLLFLHNIRPLSPLSLFLDVICIHVPYIYYDIPIQSIKYPSSNRDTYD